MMLTSLAEPQKSDFLLAFMDHSKTCPGLYLVLTRLGFRLAPNLNTVEPKLTYNTMFLRFSKSLDG